MLRIVKASNIICPKCGAEVALTEAVSHQVREELQSEFQARLAHSEREFAAKNQALLQQAALKAREESATQLRDLRATVAEKEECLARAREAELATRKKQRELETRQQDLELEVARTLDREREKIAADARKRAADEQRLRMSEKEKLIADLQTQIEALKQKAEQGSQQMQGEVLEIELEDFSPRPSSMTRSLPSQKGCAAPISSTKFAFPPASVAEQSSGKPSARATGARAGSENSRKTSAPAPPKSR